MATRWILVAAAALALLVAAPASASPHAVLIVASGGDLQVYPSRVAAGSKTVQVHSLAADPVHVAIERGGHRLFTARVAPNGWAFFPVELHPGVYAVVSSGAAGTSRAVLAVG